MKPLVKARLISTWPQTHQIVTGLCTLHRAGAIRLRWEPPRAEQTYPDAAMVEVEIDGRRLAFDMSDGYNLDLARLDRYLDRCDGWFKRSFAPAMHAGLRNAGKIHPLGFNYDVLHPDAPTDGITRLKNGVKWLLPGLRPEWAVFGRRAFEAPPHITTPPRILFAARLWPPNLADDELNREREEINATRVEIIRRLRRRFAGQFTGGIYDNPIARAMAPISSCPRRKR